MHLHGVVFGSILVRNRMAKNIANMYLFCISSGLADMQTRIEFMEVLYHNFANGINLKLLRFK